jgi:hypothetical protein
MKYPIQAPNIMEERRPTLLIVAQVKSNFFRAIFGKKVPFSRGFVKIRRYKLRYWKLDVTCATISNSGLNSFFSRIHSLVVSSEVNTMCRSVSVLAALLLTATAMTVPVPEPFVSGWDRPVDPDGDCKIRRNNGVLTIEMPGNDHDYDSLRHRVNAPRLFRDVEGDFFVQVRVRIDCRPADTSTVKEQSSYVGAGFLLISPDDPCTNCVRLEYRLAGKGAGVDGCIAQIVRDAKNRKRNGIWIWDKQSSKWPFKAKPEHVYLQLEHQRNILSCRISPDGENWEMVSRGGFAGPSSKLRVGLAAYSTSTEPSKVRIDQLKLSRQRPKEPRRKEPRFEPSTVQVRRP